MRAALAAVLLAWAGPVLAQGNPSAPEITRSLLPPEGTPNTAPDLGPGRGLRRTPPDSRAPPTGQDRPTPPDAPRINLSILFETGSDALTPSARQTLDELGKALSGPALVPYRFRIEGHTDTVGSPAGNLALSGRRAAAVVAYLADRFNVDRARLQAAGLGDGMLLVPTGPGVAEPRNRRVQVVNIGG